MMGSRKTLLFIKASHHETKGKKRDGQKHRKSTSLDTKTFG